MENTEISISISEKSGIQTVSARELYRVLEITDRFSRWFESILKFGFVEGEDFTSVKTSTLVNNGAERELQDFAITVEMAKQLCMLQRSEKGRLYREYFLKLEKAWNSPEMIMKRALQIADRKVEEMKSRLLEQKPKVDYFDSYMSTENLEEIGHLGKLTGIGEQKIFKALVAGNYIKVRRSTDGVKSYDPCFGYERYFRAVPVVFNANGKQLSRDKLMLTHEGIIYFMKKFDSRQTAVTEGESHAHD